MIGQGKERKELTEQSSSLQQNVVPLDSSHPGLSVAPTQLTPSRHMWSPLPRLAVPPPCSSLIILQGPHMDPLLGEASLSPESKSLFVNSSHPFSSQYSYPTMISILKLPLFVDDLSSPLDCKVCEGGDFI